MKPIINTLLLVSAVLGFYLPGAVAAERWETLRAINQVENPTNHTHYGPKGELGPYQFRRDTWRMYTRKPFTQATDRASADAVAVSHYESIKRQLANAGIAPTTFNIAMAWNCGINAVICGRIPTVTYRYADQVNNLAEVYAAAAAPVARELPVVHTAPVSEFAVLFRAEASANPTFRLDADAPTLRVSGQSPRFVLPPAEQQRLADAGTSRGVFTF
jgi:hypothetical protein